MLVLIFLNNECRDLEGYIVNHRNVNRFWSLTFGFDFDYLIFCGGGRGKQMDKIYYENEYTDINTFNNYVT